MIRIVLDLDRIKQTSRIKEKENFRFRTFLKGRDDKVDRIIHDIYDKISEQIDCTKCGNCCKLISPSMTIKEIGILLKIENISRKSFIENHTEADQYNNQSFLKGRPCKYLNDKKCSIYDSRPNDCKSFPHIHKKGFSSRTLGVIDYYALSSFAGQLILVPLVYTLRTISRKAKNNSKQIYN